MRFNIFNSIHKALRALLYDTALFLQRADFLNATDLQTAGQRVRLVVALFDDHAHHEDQFVLPALQQWEPGITSTFEQEHQADMGLGVHLLDSLKTLQSAPILQKPDAGRDFMDRFQAFMLFNLEHMAKEEKVLNDLLWKYYTDEEIMKIDETIVKSLTPWSQQQGSTWMMRGLNNSEIIQWLQTLKHTAPQAIYKELYNLAEQELPSHRFSEVQASLSDVKLIV